MLMSTCMKNIIVTLALGPGLPVHLGVMLILHTFETVVVTCTSVASSDDVFCPEHLQFEHFIQVMSLRGTGISFMLKPLGKLNKWTKTLRTICCCKS